MKALKGGMEPMKQLLPKAEAHWGCFENWRRVEALEGLKKGNPSGYSIHSDLWGLYVHWLFVHMGTRLMV